MYQRVIERAPPAAMNTPLSKCHASLALNNRGLLNTACKPHTRCTLNWVRQRGREGATKDGGWGREEGECGGRGSKGME